MHHFTQGECTRQGHKGIPDGCYEEEQGLKGFFGPVSHLIRKKPSTRWTQIRGELRPRMFDLVKLAAEIEKKRLFYNATTQIYFQWSKVKDAKDLTAFRSADGDLLYFCHKGSGEFFTEYGLLDYQAGQYIVIPKCIAHTINPKVNSEFLVIENLNSHYEEPDRGIVGRHAVYDPNAIIKPDLDRLNKRLTELGQPVTEIQVKHNDEFTTFAYDESIYDVIGWKGDLYPFTLHTDHMMPLMSHRAHLPPSAHTTFVARDFVVCTFLPRPLESDADALKVPFYHQNIDYDEVIFYHAGDFFSRDNLHPGMISFHPAGFPHGPHPKAVKNIVHKNETNEYAIMIDTRLPLKRDTYLDAVEVQEYWKSWST
jgi:homogentisate 1,2-dioxygenase